MKRRIFAAVVLLSMWSMFVLAVAQTNTKRSQNDSKSKPSDATTGSETDGGKLFQANCGRCHNPPESISAREARAVVRHMRVRAMLSAEDEKLILKFLAP